MIRRLLTRWRRTLSEPTADAPLIIPLETLAGLWRPQPERVTAPPAPAEAAPSPVPLPAAPVPVPSGPVHVQPSPVPPQSVSISPVRPAPVPSPPPRVTPAAQPAVPPAAPGRGTSPTRSLVDELLTPYRPLLDGVWEPLVAACEFLETHGPTTPSVVLAHAEHDTESTDLYTIRDTLAKISLRDHTARVTRHILALLRKQYRDPEPLIPKALTVALGHDLGKARILFDSGAFPKRDHPSISVIKLRELFSGTAPFWLEEALTTVAEHHTATRQPFTQLLQMADRLAREEEVGLTNVGLTTSAWETWCLPAAWLPFVAEKVNVVQRGNRWDALTMDATVYCRPEALFEAAKKLAHTRRIVDLTLVANSATEVAYRRLVRDLQQAGHLVADIGEGYYGLMYEVRSSRMKKAVKAYLVPIKLAAFGERAAAFERQKAGSYLETITSIQLVRSGSLFT